mgnify:CR=1 FL=1
MKKNLLLVALAVLGCVNVFAQDEETTVKTETYTPVGDTFVRSSAASNKYGTQNVLEIWTASDGTDFVGLMSFNLPEKEEEIAKATLVLHAERVKGDRMLTIYPFEYAIDEANDTYNTQGDNVKAARENDPIASGELNGQSNKAVTDDLGDDYKTADAWKTEFDITEYVASKGSGDINLLLTHNGDDNNHNVKVYSKDVEDVTLKDGETVFSKDDLMPKLIVEYTISSGIENVETEAADAEKKIYTISGVRVSKVTAPGIYIVNGKKMVINK